MIYDEELGVDGGSSLLLMSHGHLHTIFWAYPTGSSHPPPHPSSVGRQSQAPAINFMSLYQPQSSLQLNVHYKVRSCQLDSNLLYTLSKLSWRDRIRGRKGIHLTENGSNKRHVILMGVNARAHYQMTV